MRDVMVNYLAPVDEKMLRVVARQGQLPLRDVSKMLAQNVQAREKLSHAIGTIDGTLPESAEDIDLTRKGGS